MNVTVGLYGDDQSTFQYFRRKLSEIDVSVVIRDLRDILSKCDIYCVSIRTPGAMQMIERIRDYDEHANIVACCDDDPGIMRKLFNLDVSSVCLYGHDDELLSRKLKQTIRSKSINDRLMSKLKRLEKMNGSEKQLSRSLVS